MFSRPQIRFLSILALCLAITNASWIDSMAEDFKKRTPANENRELISSVVGGLSSDIGGGGTVGLGATGSSPTLASTTPTGKQSSSKASSTPVSSSVKSSGSVSAQSTSPISSSGASPSSSSETATAQPTTSTPTTQSVNVVTVVSTANGGATASLSSLTASSASSSASAASLSSNQSQSSGLSTKTKNTVIGVVVGVGGAIVIAGLLVVAWRIWGRNKKEDESDGLMGFHGGSNGHEKSGSDSATAPANPFQSTLESYHNPAKVNASSNF